MFKNTRKMKFQVDILATDPPRGAGGEFYELVIEVKGQQYPVLMDKRKWELFANQLWRAAQEIKNK